MKHRMLMVFLFVLVWMFLAAAGPPAVVVAPRAPEFSFWEKTWLIIRPRTDGNEALPLSYDRLRLVIRLNGSAKLQDLTKDFPEFEGEESVRIVPDREGSGSVELRVVKLKAMSESDYFKLLERLRRNERVGYVSPVVMANAFPSVILPWARVEFKSWHGPKESVAMRSFLEKRFPMFSLVREDMNGELFFLIVPNDKLAEPYLKALDRLAQDPDVRHAVPLFATIAMPIRFDTELFECGQRNTEEKGGIFTTSLGNVFCYTLQIVYDPKTVEMVTVPEAFTALPELPFHRPDLINKPLIVVKNASVETHDEKGERFTIARYTLAIYDYGDYAINGPAVRYKEKGDGIASDRALMISFPPEFVKVISQVHTETKDLEPIFREKLEIKRPVVEAPPPPPPSVPKPKSVVLAERLLKFFGKTQAWIRRHLLATALYLASLVSLIAGVLLFFSEAAPALRKLAESLFRRIARDRYRRIQFASALAELNTLLDDERSSREECWLALRKLMKRFYEGRITHFKAQTNEEVRSAVKMLEGEGLILTTLSSLFNPDISESEFREKAKSFAALIAEKVSAGRRKR